MRSLIDPALRRRFAGGLALNAGAALAGAAPAAVTAWALAQVAQGADGRALASAAALWLAALLVVQLFATVLGGRLGFAAGLAAVHRLRRRVLDHALALPTAAARRLGNGALAALLVEDARWVPEFSGYGLPRLFAHAVAAAALAGALVWLLPVAGLAILAGLLLAAAGTVRFDRALRRLAGAHATAFRAAGSALLAHLRGLIVLRAFGATAERIGLGRRAIDDLERRARARLWPTLAAGRLAPLALDLAPLPLLLLALAAADAPAALAVPCLILGLELLRLLHLAYGDLPLLRLCRMAAGRLAAFLARPPLPVAAPARTLPAGAPAIDCANVAFAHAAGRPALRDVALSLPAGGLTVLTGPSGAGKSTLVSLLLREADPDQGGLRIGGVDLRALDPAGLAGAVGLVGQRIDLFRDTLAANLRLARPTASDDELLAALAAAGAADLVRRLPQGLYAPVGDQGGALSGGERQRVAIARALLKDARLLIFDEATSALDAQTEAAVVGELRRLAGERTVILVTHRLACAAAADRIVVMADGRVEAIGHHAELLAASPRYVRLWAAHGRSGRWSLRGAPLLPFPSSTSPGDAP